jgi:hypothetical protein
MADAPSVTPPTSLPIPQNAIRPSNTKTDFVVQWGFVISAISLGLWILFKVITQDQFILINGVVICWFVVSKLTQSFFDDREKERKISYRPWDPGKELPNICVKYFELTGNRIIRIFRWRTEPEFGRISADYPHTIHMQISEQDNYGVLTTSSLSLGLLHRNFIGYEFNHFHRETGSHSWFNARKGQEPVLSPYMPSATKVVTIPTQNPIGEAPKTEKEQKEGEEEES